jgi:hypothetical protein
VTKHPSNLPRLLAEGFVVVLSILLAFGIDASWDARRDRIEAGAVLADLGREMSENLELLEFVIGIREARSAAALQLLAGAGSFSGDESLREALAVVFLDYSSVNLRTGAYSLFLAGGSTEQIQSQELRSLLASWPGLVEENTEDELIEAEMTNAVLIPFLSTRIGIAAVYSDHPAPEETYGTFPQSELEFAWTPRGLLNDPEFQNLTVMRLARNRILVREARALRDATERMVALLEEEIAR